MNLDDLVRDWVQRLKASAGAAARAVPPVAAYQQFKQAQPQVKRLGQGIEGNLRSLKYLPQNFPTQAQREQNLGQAISKHPAFGRAFLSAATSVPAQLGLTGVKAIAPKKTKELITERYGALQEEKARQPLSKTLPLDIVLNAPFYSQIGKWLEAPAELAGLKYLPKGAGIIPRATRWLGRGALGELASSAALYGPSSAYLEDKPLKQATKEQTLMGMGGRAFGTGLGIPFAALGMVLGGTKVGLPDFKIPKELEPLAKEARKFGSAEDFVRSQIDKYRGTPQLKSFERLLKRSGIKDLTQLGDFYNQTIKGAKEAGEKIAKEFVPGDGVTAKLVGGKKISGIFDWEQAKPVRVGALKVSMGDTGRPVINTAAGKKYFFGDLEGMVSEITGKAKGTGIEKRIDDLVNVGRKRMLKADQSSQALKPAEIDWLTQKERVELENLKQQLPRVSQAEAAERIRLKKEAAVPKVKIAPSYKVGGKLEIPEQKLGLPLETSQAPKLPPEKAVARIVPEEAIYTKKPFGESIAQEVPEEMPSEVMDAIEKEVRGEAQQGQWGDSLPIIKKMVNFLKMAGEKTSKETKMLFREHIPRSVFGQSTDEIATSMRMSENELMEELVAMAGIVGGDTTKVRKLITKQTPLGRATRQAIIKLPRKISIPIAEGQKVLDIGDLKELATKITKAGREVLIERGGQTIPANLVEGADLLKDIGHTRMGFGDFYRNVQRVFKKTPEAAQKQIIEPFNFAKKQYVDFQKGWLGRLNDGVVQKFGIKKGSKESALVQMFGEGDINIGDLQQQAPRAWKNIEAANNWFRAAYDELLDTVNKTRAAINKEPIPKRADYYRHFQELSGIRGIVNIFEGQANIDPRLAGISDYTQPTSKWLSFAQRRLGFKTEKDAVGGFLNYIKPAAYATHIDPQIGKMRAFREALAEQTKDTKNLNNFIEFLNDFANDLAGKTNPADRMLQKWIPGGRKTFKLVNAINNRIKANVILGNVRSSFSQIFNLPQGIASAGPKNALAGAYETVSSIATGEDFALKKSPFLQERFIHKLYDQFDVSLLNKPKKFAQWMTGALDEFGTRTTWLAHFRKGITEGMSEIDATKYADDLTRKLVAGRGVGEVPLAYKSSIVNLLAPFQLEVGNSWLVLKDFIDEKAFKKIATLFVANWMFNEVAERLHGDRIVFDPIDVAMDNIFGEDRDKPLGTKLARLGGEALSNIPFGQQVATMWPENKTEIAGREFPGREELFGRRDPTRYGTGILLSKGIQDPLFKLLPPFGGGQVKKTLGGAKLIAGGGEFGKTKGGEPKLKFPAPESFLDKARALIFGKWATSEAKKYFEGGTVPLGAKQTASFQSLVAQGFNPKTLWQQILDKRGDNQATAKATDAVIASGEMPLPEDFETLTDLYKKYLTVLKNREDSLKLLPYEKFETEIDKETRLRDLNEELGWAQQIVNRIKNEQPEQVFKIEVDAYSSGGGRSVEERAGWAGGILSKVRTKEEFNFLVDQMLKGKVLTKSVTEALAAQGLPVNWYIEGGKVKALKATGGGMKISKPTMGGGPTLKAPTVPKIRISKSKTSAATLLKPTDGSRLRIVPLKGSSVSKWVGGD